ncbi:Sulfotransferase 1E1 [Halotydeus destructor]|nr:Sulfotransferase 1E1 [Halotydeus destructor]
MLNLLVGQSWSASGHSDLMVSFRAVLVSLVISVICLSVYYIANFYLQVYKLPPGPLPLPYFGNVFRLTRGRSIHRVFLDLSKEYGKLFTFWVGGVAFINIGDTDIANEAFIKKMADFAGRPFIPGTEGMLSDKGVDITFTDYGRAWEVLRRATFSAIRRHSVSEHFASTVTEAVDEAFDEFHNKYGDQPFSATDFLYLMTYNIMGQSILNRRFVSSNETYQRLAAGSRRATKALWKLPVVQCVPWLKHIPGFKQDYDAIMRHQRFQRHLCEVAIEEHIASYQDGHIRDLTDALLASGKEAETEAPETAGHFSATNMAGVMIDMFFAGSDSNRQSMHWAILFLCTFPNVQARVRREVEDVIGDKDVSAQACAELNYTKSEDYFRSGLVYKPQKDDLFVASFPKSGTTWTQYIVCLIYGNGVPPEGPIMFGATPFLECIGGEGTDEFKRPIPIKTHLPFDMTPFCDHAKYIYVVRNPKDTCVSYYFHNLEGESHCEDYKDLKFDRFFEMFIEGTTDYNDYFDNVLSWYGQRHRKNILFITYEEMKMDIRSVIKKIASFMGNPWADMVNNDDQLLDKIVDESSAAKMKVNIDEGMKAFTDPVAMERLFPPKMKAYIEEIACINEEASDWNFIRKGKVGDWVNHFSAEQNARLTAKAKTKLANCPDLLKLWNIV